MFRLPAEVSLLVPVALRRGAWPAGLALFGSDWAVPVTDEILVAGMSRRYIITERRTKVVT